VLLGGLVLGRDDDGGGGKLLGGRGGGLVVEAEGRHELDERRQCGHCFERRRRRRRGDRCLGRPWKGREGVMELTLLNGWASSSVGSHSERWIALEDDKSHGRQDNSVLASLSLDIISFPLAPINHESTTTGCQFPARRLSLHGPAT